MSDKFKITLLASKAALAELIATGLDKHATITGIEAVAAPETPKATVVPQTRQTVTASAPQTLGFDRSPKSRVRSPKIVSGWDAYQVMIDAFHPQKSFGSRDLTAEIRRSGHDISGNAAAAHLCRFLAKGLIERIGGNRVQGHTYRCKKPVTPMEFLRR